MVNTQLGRTEGAELVENRPWRLLRCFDTLEAAGYSELLSGRDFNSMVVARR